MSKLFIGLFIALFLIGCFSSHQESLRPIPKFKMGEIVTFGECVGVITNTSFYRATWEHPQVLRVRYNVGYYCSADKRGIHADISGAMWINEEDLAF